MAVMATHRVTMPKRMSNLLSRRAKAQNTSFSQAFVSMVEDAIEYEAERDLEEDAIDYEEERYLGEVALERERTCTGKLIPNDEFWKLANEIPYNP